MLVTLDIKLFFTSCLMSNCDSNDSLRLLVLLLVLLLLALAAKTLVCP